jgi:hypothetical protein
MRTQFGRSRRQSSRGDSGAREERSIRWQLPVDPFFSGFFRLPSGSASNAAPGKITAPPADVIPRQIAVFAGFCRLFALTTSHRKFTIGPVRSRWGRKPGTDRDAVTHSEDCASIGASPLCSRNRDSSAVSSSRDVKVRSRRRHHRKSGALMRIRTSMSFAALCRTCRITQS